MSDRQGLNSIEEINGVVIAETSMACESTQALQIAIEAGILNSRSQGMSTDDSILPCSFYIEEFCVRSYFINVKDDAIQSPL
jgi:hypothetical protein